MAVESVGLAASVAGILSLGLQITKGIIKYVDALENRQEELDSLKVQSEVLKAVLQALDTHLSPHGQAGAVSDAVVQSMQLFRKELIQVQALHSDLKDSDPQSWTSRMTNRKKKITYAFKRSKIKELELRLQKAGDALQLALDVLGVQVLRQNTNTLAAVKSSSQGVSSGLSVFRSELAAIEMPIVKISDELRLLRHDVDSRNQLVVSQYEGLLGYVQRCRNEVARNVQETTEHWAQFQAMRDQEMANRYEEMTNNMASKIKEELRPMIDHLQQSASQTNVREAIIRGLAGKPALLKELSEEVQPPGRAHDQVARPDLCARPLKMTAGFTSRHYPSKAIIGSVCTCPRLRNETRSNWLQLGHASFYNEWSTKAHFSGCPMAKMNQKQRVTLGFKYNGLARILKTAVNVSFAMTSGAGGFSLSPNFTCSPTVDENFDPAFRLVSLIDNGLLGLMEERKPEYFMAACIKRLIRVLDDRRVYATAVNADNESLMHFAVSTLLSAVSTQHCEKVRRSISNLYVELVQVLLSYGISAFAFTLRGMSPLAKLAGWQLEYDVVQAVMHILIQANSENQPLVLDASHLQDTYGDTAFSIPTMCAKSTYDASSGFAEACECGPLSMAVIQGNAKVVEDMLECSPGLIAETNILGQTPFHLAAANAPILKILLQYGDWSSLNKRDMSGLSALETSMIHTSDRCDNGRDAVRCDGIRCCCCQCVDLLLDSDCDLRLDELSGINFEPELHLFLEPASELARRKYIYHMKTLRDSSSVVGSVSSTSYASASQSHTEPGLERVDNNNPGLSRQCESSWTPNVADDMSWVFTEFKDPHLGALFYRHGFRPDCSLFAGLRPDRHYIREIMNIPYFHWLLCHGVDLYFRSSKGPAFTENIPNMGLFGAHFAFFFMELRVGDEVSTQNAEFQDTHKDALATVSRQNLTDGCKCHCTIDGCSPFTWMMKGSHLMSISGHIRHYDIEILMTYFNRCGVELTLLTYKAAIRYATFGALGLTHTCCKIKVARTLRILRFDREDIDLVNEEQTGLLNTLEALVEEFEKVALRFMKQVSSGRNLFARFWDLHWKVRMEKVLRKLDGNELTDGERRGAEEIGVRWAVSQQETDKGNPYIRGDLAHWFYELDRICPEYAEPWPEELRRISHLP